MNYPKQAKKERKCLKYLKNQIAPKAKDYSQITKKNKLANQKFRKELNHLGLNTLKIANLSKI